MKGLRWRQGHIGRTSPAVHQFHVAVEETVGVQRPAAASMARTSVLGPECQGVCVCVYVRAVKGSPGRYLGTWAGTVGLAFFSFSKQQGSSRRSWGATLSAKERAGASVGSVKMPPPPMAFLAWPTASPCLVRWRPSSLGPDHRTDETLRADMAASTQNSGRAL